jgi:DNA-directed RNA polymerase subunit RPC12/RpoP
MEFQDKVLKCIDCGSDFVFTAGEQLFFHDKQFKNEPKRCKACKTKRISVLGAPPRARTELPLHEGRNPGHLLGMRKTDDCSFPSDARPPRLLPGMFSVAENCGFGVSCGTNVLGDASCCVTIGKWLAIL